MEWTVINTDMGWVSIVSSERGLSHISVPYNSPQESLESLGKVMKDAKFSLNRFGDLPQRLKAYFSGYRISFTDALDFSDATNFQREVWQEARRIPYGETRSYAWLADRVGQSKAWRAVGQALAKNRLPIIIPCHRVISSNCNLGGFSGGLDMKKRLLQLEVTAISPKS
ncbi:MAG: methylated-DNA--[protein]-cysteine S-methyltransferase [Dehalococcoidia bacterium]|nr:MAG: methylated-DNA--[protein]-cysteine S-methyltransferase [Dehalococcoidia bacterium]